MLQEINKGSFNDYKNSEELTLVKFTANWCAPCKMLDPVLEQYSENNENFKIGKVDIEQHSELANEYNIRSIPTTMFFKGGELLETKVGVFDNNYLSATITKYE